MTNALHAEARTRASSLASNTIDRKVNLTVLRLLYDQLPKGLAATVFNAFLLSYTLSGVVAPTALKLWFCAMVFVCLGRAISVAEFRQRQSEDLDTTYWRNAFVTGAVATAFLWGVAGLSLFPSSSPQHQAFIGFVLAGMAAGASGSMSADDKIFRAYLLLAIAPYTARVFIEGSSVNLAMAAMSAAFIAILTLTAKRNARVTRDALRLRFVNDELAHDLERTLMRNQAANAALQQEIGKHQDTMQSLQKAAQDANASVAAKSQFLANMSHEIRTPMNGVFGMTDLLMRTNLDARQKKLVGTIGESARSLLTIINDILDLSRIEAGKLDLDVHEFNLRELVEQSVELFASECHKTGLDISLYIDNAVPVYAKADSGRVKQIILNIIGNAIKFTKYGEISIRVTAAEKSEAGTRVRFEIRDTGIGIDRAVLDKLFQAFSQAETSISRRFGGTGLGLAITRHLSEMMGGTVKLESELGKGTVATVELQLAHGERSESCAASDPGVLEGARMLVIDDRDTNRDIVTNYLEGCSAKVTAVSSTAAAWPMLVAADAIGKPFHAAIVDMIMPDENGLEFATRIKAHPALSRLKVIIATSIDWQGDVAAIREAGIEGVLTKPIRRNDLIDAAARAVSGTRHAGWRPTPTGNGKSSAQDIAESQQKRLEARILLAEDNPVNVEVAKEYLTSFGCTVQVASNGLEALAAVKLAPFDIILMDCQMAVMDGLTATRRIRGYEKESHAQPTPVIALTANAFAEDKARCLSSGMNDYLSKPYSERQLYSVVTKWLSDPAQNIDAAETCIGNDTNEAGALADLTSATCCLDEAALAPMRSSRPELLARIFATFLDHAPTLLNDLRSAADEGDGERMSRHAHSLKSSSANLGAMALSAHCRELEKTAKTNDLETSRELARQIFADFEVVKIALNTEMVALTVPAKILKEVG